MFFWTWPIVIGGQLLVALVFAELASHFPVAGSVYQWSKRLSQPDPRLVHGLVLLLGPGRDGQRGRGDRRVRRRRHPSATEGFLDTPAPIRAHVDVHASSRSATLVITTLINAYGVRLLAILNNIGVATEILGHARVRARAADLRERPAGQVLTQTFGAEAAQNGNIPATFVLGFFMSRLHRVRLRYGRHVRRGDASTPSRQAPRGVLSSILISGLVGVDLHPGGHPRVAETSRPRWRKASAGGFPIATTISDAFTQDLIVGLIRSVMIYLFVILASVFVCTLAIQGAATRLMFSMGRDRHLPFGGLWGKVNTPVPDAGQRGRRRRRHRRAARSWSSGRSAAISISIAATGLIYLSYFMCNAGVLRRPDAAAGRTSRPGSTSGRWGKLVNILALIYGGLMIINIALWADTGLFGDFGGRMGGSTGTR